MAPYIKFNLDFTSALNEQARVEGIKNLRQLNFNKIIHKMKQYLYPHAVGLEIGSSYGWFMELAKNNNFNCYGIEPEEKMYTLSKELGLNVINGFFPQDVPDNVINLDFIIFNDSFEHIPDIYPVLDKCYNLLKNNGIVIINLPLSSGIFYKLAQFFYIFKYKSFLNRLWQFNFHSPHYFYFNKSNLEKLVKKFKFELIDYHRLDTLNPDSISKRISMDNTFNKYAHIMVYILKTLYPYMKYLNEDIGCFYIKKSSKYATG